MILPRRRWPKSFMVKAARFGVLRTMALGMLVGTFFMSGCTSRLPAESPVPAPNKPASLPESRAASQAAEAENFAEQNVIADVDAQSSVFFPLGSSIVSQREREKIVFAAERVKGDKGLSLTLIGHANDNGSRSFNLAVADARVESVSAILKKLGVKVHQFKKVVSGGEKTPSVCRSEACRRMMRRVEMVISTGP